MKINSEYSKLCLTAQQEVGVRSYAAYKVRRNTMSPGELQLSGEGYRWGGVPLSDLKQVPIDFQFGAYLKKEKVNNFQTITEA